MNKKVINPIDLNIDDTVFTIENKSIKNTGLKLFTTKPLTIDQIANNRKNRDELDVELFDNETNESVSIRIPKKRYTPEKKSGEIFVTSDQALNAVRVLVNDQFEAAKNAYEALGNLKDLYANKKDLTPHEDATPLIVNIEDNSVVASK